MQISENMRRSCKYEGSLEFLTEHEEAIDVHHVFFNNMMHLTDCEQTRHF